MTTTWNLDPAHSSIAFSVRHLMFAKVRGKFGTFSGAATVDEADLARSKADVTIEAASIDTGVADRDKHLRSADFFDTDKHPKITFQSTQIEKTGDDRYRVTGKLSMHGVTKDVSLELEHHGRAKDPWGKERMAFTGRGELNRADFGLKWNQALETGGVVVGDKVGIELDVQLVKA